MDKNKIKIIKLSENKILSFISFLVLKFASYSFFTPFIFLLWVDLIFLLLIIQTSWVIDIKSFFESLWNFLYNIFWERLNEWTQDINTTKHYDENDLKNFIWNILFYISIIFWMINYIFNKIFKKDIKINILKIIKYIIIFSYFIYISFFYFIPHDFSIFWIIIWLIPLLLYVYFSSFIAIKFNKWANIIFNWTFNNNTSLNK